MQRLPDNDVEAEVSMQIFYLFGIAANLLNSPFRMDTLYESIHIYLFSILHVGVKQYDMRQPGLAQIR